MGAPITASVVTDSVSRDPERLTSFLTRSPKFTHAEMCRHRAFSLCVSSSRAIPTKRYLEIVRSDGERAEPAFWGAEQKGMSPGEELRDYPTVSDWKNEKSAYVSPKVEAQIAWTRAAMNAAHEAEKMVALGVHKSIANRLLDPFVPVNVLVTSCEAGLLNWFGLRLDRAADPTIRALAEAMWVAWNESRPQTLLPGEWHLLFVDEETENELKGRANDEHRQLKLIGKSWLDEARKVSAARCARLSYMSYETGKRSTIEEDLALYDRLLGSRPIHASPAEHQATPDTWSRELVDPARNYFQEGWRHPELHGNLPGWIQHRKTLPDEAVATLPAGYEYNRAWGG